MFLSVPQGFGRGPSGHSAVPLGANCPHGSPCVFLREHGISFHPCAVTPEMLPSLKRRLFWERRSHRRVTEPFRNAYRFGLPCRDGVGLSPVSVVSRCTQARSPVTSSVRGTEPSFVLRENKGDPSFPRLRRAWERGPPTRPKRDPSRVTLAWPLRHRPLPSDAGCAGSFRELRARVSARGRPRTGRIE